MQNSHLTNASKFSLFNLQVSGKAPKLVSDDNKFVLKCFIETQCNFYNYMFCQTHVSHPHYALKTYLPSYMGLLNLQRKPQIHYIDDGANKDISIWLEHVKNRYDKKNEDNKFILMGNFLSQYSNPNIFDIKIGGRAEKPHKITKSVSEYRLKLNGIVKTDENNKQQFFSKYMTNQIQTQKDMLGCIAYFFTQHGELNIRQIRIVIDKLKDLVLCIRSMRGWKFVSTSICMIYNSKNLQSVDLKYIDFGRAFANDLNENYDDDTSFGLETLIRFLHKISQNKQNYCNLKLQKFGQIVPNSKVKKFEAKSIN